MSGTMTKTLLSIGHGYCAKALTPLLLADGWAVIGTTRRSETAKALRATGITPMIWPDADLDAALRQASHLLISAPPSGRRGPVVRVH